VVKKVLAQQKNLPAVDLHILVSDSHSPDGTPDIVKRLAGNNPKVHYLDVKERGIGVGLVKGHRWAVDRLKADVLAQMDGDLSHDPSTLAVMLEYINKGYDLVNGSRSMPGGKNLLGWHRRLFSTGMSIYCRLSWGTFRLTEYANSYRMFTKKLFQSIDFSKVPWRSKTYVFQPAFLYAAMSSGAKIKEVPITFEDRKRGYSKAQIVAYTLDVLKFGIKVRIARSRMFVKFLMVGTASYLVNATVLGLLNRGQIYTLSVLPQPILSFVPTLEATPKIFIIPLDRLFVASVISIELSIIVNFLFHDNWTFRYRSREGRRRFRFLKFNFTSFGSPLIQLASILLFARTFHLHEQIGLAFGVVVGLFVNYFVNTFWIWKAYPEQTTA
ncbi:glycosyltransferase, partial [Candidatus Curtissbacteria bacterium]|nr:glycosyltransferase [Candidatus Curtissbacteria bacterium]